MLTIPKNDKDWYAKNRMMIMKKISHRVTATAAFYPHYNGFFHGGRSSIVRNTKSRIVVLRIKSQIFSLKKQMNLSKWRSFLVVALPAFCHQIANFPWASVRGRQDHRRTAFSPHIWQTWQVYIFVSRGITKHCSLQSRGHNYQTFGHASLRR